MKNALKNNPDAQPDLLNTSKNSKPIASAHATAHQLSAALGFADLDETFLRNRAAQGVIPKPIRGLWDITATPRWMGSTYGATTPESVEALELAKVEGLELEPVYTAKALAAILDGNIAGPILYLNTHGPRPSA